MSAHLRHLRRVARAAYWLATLQIGARLRERRHVRQIHASGLFDSDYYTSHNPDVAAAGIDPVLHYVAFGASEGRNPSADFDTVGYVEEHPEATRHNPLIHYLETRDAQGVAPPRPLDDRASRLPADMVAALRAASRASRQAAAGWEPLVPHIAVAGHPRASLIVTASGDGARLARCLLALHETAGSTPVEVLVVGKPEPAIEALIKKTGVVFIDAADTSPSAWPNLAARTARGDYLVLLDDHVVALPGWLDALLDTFARFPDAGAVGTYQLLGDGRRARGGGIIRATGHLGMEGNAVPIGHQDMATVHEVDFSPLNGLAVRAEDWREIGGIDARFRTRGHGAADLAMRLRASGPRVLYQPFARVALPEVRRETDFLLRHDDLSLMRSLWRAKAEPMRLLTISVVIPLYNHERYIAEALQSVLRQSRPAQEIIVIDDGSTDRSAEIARQIAKERPLIRFSSQENAGAHHAINAGIRQATGDLVAILNSDDIYHPDRLAVMTEEFEAEPDLNALATAIDFIDENGVRIANPWYEQGIESYQRTRDLVSTLVGGNILMTTSNLLARRSLFQQVGGFSPLRYAHDLDFLLRLIAKGKTIRLLDEPLLNYRQHSTNTIREDALKVKAETTAATAFFLHRLWDRSEDAGTDWRLTADLLAALERNGLTAPVMLCLAYFRRHSTDTMEDNPFHADEAFRRIVAEMIASKNLPSAPHQAAQ